MRTLSGVGFPAIDVSRRVRLLAAFAAVYVLWGSTYLAIALGLRSIPPLLLMGARSVIGGAILLGAVALSGSGPPRQDAWLPALAGGCCSSSGATARSPMFNGRRLRAPPLSCLPRSHSGSCCWIS